ncbi:ribosomal protein S18 acetylase RimI-like enzyme [Paenibacillus endophyticus]|uniref:Ribosomal protein S18 acetylase RimI-like enzyme n=1 Tax=Paenibacillus endophyticus TaxID=1294268 RepID=A0A7W5CCN3_9BACL|nr:GNAT family N-acetyltransferase [Paenibacillus endophyticus]MBB3155281.1 ribosomal protein S18 acetylase RimI-like enzyme [Paenibacillus endophyticus]
MKVSAATENDLEWIKSRDHHLAENLIASKIREREILLLRVESEAIAGWMRFGYFWDNTPFMNMIWIEEQYRGTGLGKHIVEFWENEMKQQGFSMVMTSTQADEGAQHFYRKLGYKDAGSLLLDSQPLEIIFTKKLR